MYYLGFTDTYLEIGKNNANQTTFAALGARVVNFDAPAALTALDNGTMLRCLAALAFETDGQLPAEPATIIFDLVTQAELPVSLGERVTESAAEPKSEPAQEAGQYYILHSAVKLIIGQSEDDGVLSNTDMALMWVATSEDLDSMPSDLMLRVLLALGYDKGTLPPEASDYTFKLMQRTSLPVTFDGELEPLPTVKKNRRTKKNDLQSDAEQITSPSPGGDVASEATTETTMTDQEKKANDKAKAAEKKANDKAKADAAKLKASEKKAADKLKADEAKAKEKAKLQAAKDKERDAKAKAKEKAAADKAKGKVDGGPKAPRGEKTLLVKKLLERKSGCTRKDILEATGWPAVSVQAMAKACGLTLRSEKDETVKGKSMTYFGS